jgi:hypothetical protein
MKRLVAVLAQSSALALGLTVAGVAGAGAAHADITRCVGAVETPGAYACYTSPRFDHLGLERRSVATLPVVCYGLACTGAELKIFVPDDEVGGRFTSISYLGHAYTVSRPTPDQPYLVTSDNQRFVPVTDVEKVLVATAIDALSA